MITKVLSILLILNMMKLQEYEIEDTPDGLAAFLEEHLTYTDPSSVTNPFSGEAEDYFDDLREDYTDGLSTSPGQSLESFYLQTLAELGIPLESQSKRSWTSFRDAREIHEELINEALADNDNSDSLYEGEDTIKEALRALRRSGESDARTLARTLKRMNR